MTTFEEEIFIKIKRIKHSQALKGATQGNTTEEQAKAAAEVAKKYIERAFLGGYFTEDVTNDDVIAMKHGQTLSEYFKEKWLKENGVI